MPTLDQLRKAMDSAPAKMLQAGEIYMAAADRFMSDPSAFGEFETKKNALNAAIQVYNDACDAYFNAARSGSHI